MVRRSQLMIDTMPQSVRWDPGSGARLMLYRTLSFVLQLILLLVTKLSVTPPLSFELPQSSEPLTASTNSASSRALQGVSQQCRLIFVVSWQISGRTRGFMSCTWCILKTPVFATVSATGAEPPCCMVYPLLGRSYILLRSSIARHRRKHTTKGVETTKFLHTRNARSTHRTRQYDAGWSIG